MFRALCFTAFVGLVLSDVSDVSEVSDVPDVDLQCGPNEHVSHCYNSCTEPKCTPKPGQVCPMYCGTGCSCNEGFVRSSLGVCIPKKLCKNPCDNFYCLIGPCTVNKWGQPVCEGTLPPRDTSGSESAVPVAEA